MMNREYEADEWTVVIGRFKNKFVALKPGINIDILSNMKVSYINLSTAIALKLNQNIYILLP